ncbi:hypothetical protein Q3G72_030630 [Acer saccharum]|nr:hypothetical protein Q3G72_030630 [Acer saccharum]
MLLERKLNDVRDSAPVFYRKRRGRKSACSTRSHDRKTRNLNGGVTTVNLGLEKNGSEVRTGKGFWNLEEEITKVIESGVALGVDMSS